MKGWEFFHVQRIPRVWLSYFGTASPDYYLDHWLKECE